MKYKVLCLVAAMSPLLGCKPEEDEKTKYPGELGAWCDSKEACDGPLHCTTDYLQNEHTINFCTRACEKDDDCGADGLCTTVPFSNQDYTKRVTQQVCVRRCANTEFCVDLNAETNACTAWDGNPPQAEDPDLPKYCGFRG